MYSSLFQKGRIGAMETRNRIVMTAMGNYLADPDGSVSEADIAFYGERAKGGVGLIITECTIVDYLHGKGNDRQISVSDDKYIPGLKRLADEIHKHGSRLVVQIYHPGRQGIAAINGGYMAAPSDVPCHIVQQPIKAMTIKEIQQLVENFAQGALRVKQAGADGVEIHGAHGYLITQFLSPYTNERTDIYGGSLENRLRFLMEIISAVRDKCGEDYPILVRLSADEFLGNIGRPGEGIVLEDSLVIAKELEKAGVDCLDISAGIYETMNVAWEPSSYEQGWKSYLQEKIKKEVNIPVIGACVIRDPKFADELIAQGKMDFVGSARQHYADPSWSVKAEEGRENEIRKCISCLYCMETLMSAGMPDSKMGCSINIKAGSEVDYNELKRDGKGRVVAVIGGGPAGMEAARVLGMRGFTPVIFEKQNYLGGQLELANKPPKKQKINWLIEYLENQLELLKVQVHKGKSASIEEIKKLNPYAVIIAQGSHPIMPSSIPGMNNDNVHDPVQILNGNVKFQDKKVAVIGSGMTGIETADLLAEAGNQVSLFEMCDTIGPGLFFQNLMDVMGRIESYGVSLYPKHKLVSINDGKAVFEVTDTKEVKRYAFDAFVVSMGTAPNEDGCREIESSFENVKVIGDAAKPGKIRNAMETAFITAYNL